LNVVFSPGGWGGIEEEVKHFSDSFVLTLFGGGIGYKVFEMAFLLAEA
jgi:hypothetical protein